MKVSLGSVRGARFISGVVMTCTTLGVCGCGGRSSARDVTPVEAQDIGHSQPTTAAGSSTSPARIDAETAPCPVDETDGVEGTFTVNGKTAALTHVYALMKPDVWDEDQDVLTVFLSDGAIDEAFLPDASRLAKTVLERHLHLIEIKFSREARPFHLELSGDGSNQSVSGSGFIEFVPRYFEGGKRLAGVATFGDPRAETDDRDVDDWSFTATFSTHIVPRPKEVLAALDSPPAKVVQRFLLALTEKDQEGIRATLTPSMASDLDLPGAGFWLFSLEKAAPTLRVAKVVMLDQKTAEVRLRAEDENDELRVKVRTVMMNGEWRLAGEADR